MKFSVVINTFNRAGSLAVTLDALKYQTHEDFEVVVVNGPSTDGTADLLRRRPEVRPVDCPERHLAKSRNLGIDAAAGDVVAFIDDDAVPEPRWLEDLARSYENPSVGGAGGLVLDATGTTPQFRYSVCSRIGDTDFDRAPPFAAYNRPGADPFMYLQGTNCSFRREALERIHGFDEEIEYNYDESEVCARIIDAGWTLETRSDAAVHHKVLPSHMRDKNVLDPFIPIKNRTYFAVRVGREAGRPMSDIVQSLSAHLAGLQAGARAALALGEATPHAADRYLTRLGEGFELGFERGLEGRRKSRAIAACRPSEFKQYPTVRADGRRLVVCFVTLDHPPRPVGGVARFTADLAQGFAAAGHEAHVVTRDDDVPFHVEFDNGVWVHRFPVPDRWLPTLDASASKGNIEHLAAVHAAVSRIAQRASIDVVAGSLWAAEPLLCAYDPRWATAVFCITPMRTVTETHPHTARQPHVTGQIALEDETLRSGAHLQSVSHANAVVVRGIDGVDTAPMTVTWLGLRDRRADFSRHRHDDAIEVLFVGRLEPRKGVDVLLQAAIEVLRDHATVRLRLIGGDNAEANGEHDHFQRWVAEHAADVAPRVMFEGVVDDETLYQALADADVFCAPSRYESFGLVHVEAMMMELPVIACRAGGMQETVVDEESGLLVPPADAKALEAALRRLVDDRHLREAMGKAGRARFERHFDLTVAVAANVALYRSLAAVSRPADTAAARQHLMGRTSELLRRVFGLTSIDAADTAELLLDPRAFPVDHQAVARSILALPDDLFVAELYKVVLDRMPDPEGMDSYLHRLAAGATRTGIVAEFAAAPEARGRHVDGSLLSQLPEISWSDLVVDLRAAWLEPDDDVFVRALHRIVLGEVDERTAVSDAGTLRRGGSRDDLLRSVTGRVAAHRRVVRPGQLASLRYRTLHDVEGDITAAALAGEDDACVRGLYGALFDREADAAGVAAFVALAQREGRPRVVLELASSEEARRLGITSTMVPTLVAAAAIVSAPAQPDPVPDSAGPEAPSGPEPRRLVAAARRRFS